jgi:hypothetical protein
MSAYLEGHVAMVQLKARPASAQTPQQGRVCIMCVSLALGGLLGSTWERHIKGMQSERCSLRGCACLV